MSEYSRAPGRRHRATAGERAMQVDRQPSPWPCVAMLAALLLLCLMAPRYWQNSVTPEDPAIGSASEVAVAETTLGDCPIAYIDFSAKSEFADWVFGSGRTDI